MAKKILIMEDDELLAKILERKLTESGFETHLVTNGNDGIEFLKTTIPDLVLLDMLMPGKDGFEVMQEMNNNENTSLLKIPVIIVSNSGQPVEINKAIDLGIKDYLVKTKFDPQEVIDKVHKQLEG